MTFAYLLKAYIWCMILIRFKAALIAFYKVFMDKPHLYIDLSIHSVDGTINEVREMHGLLTDVLNNQINQEIVLDEYKQILQLNND